MALNFHKHIKKKKKEKTHLHVEQVAQHIY